MYCTSKGTYTTGSRMHNLHISLACTGTHATTDFGSIGMHKIRTLDLVRSATVKLHLNRPVSKASAAGDEGGIRYQVRVASTMRD